MADVKLFFAHGPQDQLDSLRAFNYFGEQSSQIRRISRRGTAGVLPHDHILLMTAELSATVLRYPSACLLSRLRGHAYLFRHIPAELGYEDHRADRRPEKKDYSPVALNLTGDQTVPLAFVDPACPLSGK